MALPTAAQRLGAELLGTAFRGRRWSCAGQL